MLKSFEISSTCFLIEARSSPLTIENTAFYNNFARSNQNNLYALVDKLVLFNCLFINNNFSNFSNINIALSNGGATFA